jgi:Uma2 family endonuclease
MATAVDTHVGAPAGPRRMTLQEFLDHPWGDVQAELVGGEVRIMNFPAAAHAWMVRAIYDAVSAHGRERRLGQCFPANTGYALPHRADTARGPDVSFVRAGRITLPLPRRGIFEFAPDLAVEVLSEDDRYTEVREKLADYFAAGTALAWVVDSRRRVVEVHEPGREVRVVAEGETLDGAPVLPDFRLPVAEIFADIAPER